MVICVWHEGSLILYKHLKNTTPETRISERSRVLFCWEMYHWFLHHIFFALRTLFQSTPKHCDKVAVTVASFSKQKMVGRKLYPKFHQHFTVETEQ